MKFLINIFTFFITLLGTINAQVTIEDTIFVGANWNMIGAIQAGAAFDIIRSEPPGNIISNIYKYNQREGYQQIDTLEKGIGYWIKVNEDGLLIFKVQYVSKPPNQPSNPFPADYSRYRDTTITVSWTCTDPDDDTLKYDVYFGADLPPTTKVSSNQLDTSLIIGGLNENVTYYWRVVAKDEYNDSAGGPVWRFLCDVSDPPNQPSNPFPADYSRYRNTTITVSWTCTDPDDDALKYDVYFGADLPPTTKISSNQLDTSLIIGGLNEGLTYYWRVVAKDEYNDSAGGPVWRFLCDVSDPPNQPSNPFPADYSTHHDTTITVSWTCTDPDDDALKYDVYFGADLPPTTKVSSNQLDTSLIIGGLNEGLTYYWRVVAKDEHNDSTSGPIWEFLCEGIEILCPLTVDHAGKTYNTVKIGRQCWLKENLDIGTMIDGTMDQTNNGTIEKLCYDNNPANCDKYGGLYQWDEAMQYTTTVGAQGICPSGWHIPTYSEFQTLIAAVNTNGAALKAIGQGTGDGAGTNTSGFSALLSGYQRHDGAFLHLGYYTYFWSSVEYSSTTANYLHLSYGNNFIYFYYGYKKSVISVRCIQ